MRPDRHSSQAKTLRRRLQQWRDVLLVAPVVTGVVIAVNATGILQGLEWAAYDQFFRMRPLEPVDSRITVVTIDEPDISAAGGWPVSDAVLAKAIQNLKSYQPSVIGIDLYRDIAVNPGHSDLVRVYQTTSNLIGVEKSIDPAVPPPKDLDEEKVAFADTPIDDDGQARRALLSLVSIDQIKLGLGTKTALMYLDKKGIKPQDLKPFGLRLGKAEFQPLQSYDGAYVRVDDSSYQMLLNFRGPDSHFQRIALRDVLANKIPESLIRDRIVFVGTVAASIHDVVRLPYDINPNQSPQTPGVFIHANIASQIISAALDGRPLIRVWPEPLEWLWALGWAYLGASGVRPLLNIRKSGKSRSLVWVGAVGLAVGMSLFPIHYGLMLLEVWVPFMPALLAFYGAAAASILLQTQRLQGLAYIDELTQVVNRRYFDQFLQQQFQEQRAVSLILCDIDYFKRYNDTYGHQMGDRCLQQVAQTMRQAVRGNDLVARYGGEEFALVLPNASLEVAMLVAERVRKAILALEIPHAGSEVHAFITLSSGVAFADKETVLKPKELIQLADDALYEAKKQGRNQAVQFTAPI